ncbi:Trypsin-like peptidase domain-containing protein [Amphibacillus marinus]|uniref:Trypsin-like peptidase domain-containing protein n=1 Tax=Amphibacillus marinus TaxID=872970 RepID=A0A1H8R3Q7_9BACI|nr:serine protease [Amphibacillus marinus]SEO61309.1 Trypsin-like peptidase domain-containing protein [Amphibacillus marinus]
MREEEDVAEQVIDRDLFEDLSEDEMLAILEADKQIIAEKRRREKERNMLRKRRFPKWIYAIIIAALLLNAIALLPKTFSIPAIDFLITSAQLSADPDIQMYKEAVVVIETTDSKGTGFGISMDGYIVTNAHVVKDNEAVTVAYPNHGLYHGEIVRKDDDLDLAIIKVDETGLPFLELADEAHFDQQQSIRFIGNPLRFNGIANKGDWIGITNATSLNTDVMLINAPVYRGNSGSPVINNQGLVIGVIYAVSNNDQHGKVGLAIPIQALQELQ